MKKVYKYRTGQEVPNGAIYLDTQVETLTYKLGPGRRVTRNEHVWHYFLVDIKEKTK